MTATPWERIPDRMAARWKPTSEDLQFDSDEAVSMYSSWTSLRTTVARRCWAAALSQKRQPIDDLPTALRYLASVTLPYPGLHRHAATLGTLITQRRFSNENTVIPTLVGPANTGKTTTALVSAILSPDMDFSRREPLLEAATAEMPASTNSPIPLVLVRGRLAQNRDLMRQGLNFTHHPFTRSDGAGDLQTRLLSLASRSGTRVILIDNEHGVAGGAGKDTFLRDLVQASPALVLMTRVTAAQDKSTSRTPPPTIDPDAQQIHSREIPLNFAPMTNQTTMNRVAGVALRTLRVRLPSERETAQIVQAVYAAADRYPARMFHLFTQAASLAYLTNNAKLTLDLCSEVIQRRSGAVTDAA